MKKIIPIYIRFKGNKLQIKRFIQNLDLEFWEDLEDKDLEEAIEEYVRNSFDFYEPID